MALIEIRTVCTATVKETWTFEIADELAAQAVEDREFLDELWAEFASPEDQGRLTYVEVINADVYDEEDREILSVDLVEATEG